MIKFDLHIHSIESQYKEDDTIVSKSTPDNANILLEKLNEHEVALFSITDHNRFNVDLYLKLDEMMSSNDSKYPNVKGLVAGVEFDVRLDSNMKKCHIICIFDTNNKKENYEKIKNAIDKNLLTGHDDFYEKNQFENILKDIGLNVILIACQRSSLGNSSQKHNSLSESTSDPMEMINSGYINALEFQKPNVEGILKNDLQQAKIDSGLVMGTDCHEWTAYPMHDSKLKPISFHHSRAKILPTFKGLLMAFTSPKTRFDVKENSNTNYIKSIHINEKEINLVNGINVIIGENGSGKSSLLSILNNDTSQNYIKQIQKNNNISCDIVGANHIRYIGQGDIVKKFSDNSLFQDNYYTEVDTSAFCASYRRFSSELYEFIKSNIEAHSAIIALKQMELESFEDRGKNYYIDIKSFSGNSNSINEHENKRNELIEIINKIIDIKKDNYYNEYSDEFSKILHGLIDIERKVLNKSNKTKRTIWTQNNITSSVNTYKSRIKEASSSYDNETMNKNEKRHQFIEKIIDAMYKKSNPRSFPNIPHKHSGQSSKIDGGFSFNCEAAFNNKDVIDEFYAKMFNKGYRNQEALSKICTYEEFKKAIRQCNDIEKVKDIYDKNYKLFEEEMIVCKRYIVDGTKNNLGNTLGEMSLAYFKFTIQNDSKDIYLIDQPEDHISNLNISSKLITYFNTIRNAKQLIIVTHNPLLAVNQDADNIIYISKNNDKIEVLSGSLEYEDEKCNILSIIADHMDGGTDSIRKRLKVYE